MHGPLFPGKSCYPMSPVKKQLYDKEGRPTNKELTFFEVCDQLNLIFNIIGTPCKQDIEAIEREDIQEYLRNFSERKPADLEMIYPEASKEDLELLVGMLQFNPKKRLSVEQCLNHRVFGGYEKEGKQCNNVRIALDFERDDMHLCSYDIRALLLREVNFFNKIERFDYLGSLIREITQVSVNTK